MTNESDFKPRGEIVLELEKIKREIKDLRDDLKQKKIVLEKYEMSLSDTEAKHSW
jgi:hypothetical protein